MARDSDSNIYVQIELNARAEAFKIALESFNLGGIGGGGTTLSNKTVPAFSPSGTVVGRLMNSASDFVLSVVSGPFEINEDSDLVTTDTYGAVGTEETARIEALRAFPYKRITEDFEIASVVNTALVLVDIVSSSYLFDGSAAENAKLADLTGRIAGDVVVPVPDNGTFIVVGNELRAGPNYASGSGTVGFSSTHSDISGTHVTPAHSYVIVAPDLVPDAFTFANVTGAQFGSTVPSTPVIPQGYNKPTTVTITGGQYQIDGGNWSSSSGTISPGQSINVRATASNTPSAVVTVTLNVGGTVVTWTVTSGVALNAITISTATFSSTAVAGDELFTITGKTAGSVLTLVNAAGQIVLNSDGTKGLKGLTPFGDNFSFSIREAHAIAGNNDANHEYKESGPYSASISTPSVDPTWDIAKSAGSTYFLITEDGKRVNPTALSDGTRRNIQLNSEVAPGQKRRFRLYLTDHGFGRARFGFAQKGVFNPVTAGNGSSIGDNTSTVACYPHNSTVQINGATVATFNGGGQFGFPGWVTIDIDMSLETPAWVVTPPGGTRSAALPLPASAATGGVMIPTFTITNDGDRWARFDNDPANWAVGVDTAFPGFTKLTSTSGGASTVTVSTYTELQNAFGAGKTIIVNDGNYPQLNLEGQTFSPAMTIKAANARGAKFAGGLIRSSKGITLQGLEFNAPRADVLPTPPQAGGEIISVRVSEDINLINCHILHEKYKSIQAPVIGSSDTPVGCYAINNKNFNVINTEIEFVSAGVIGGYIEGGRFSGNHIHHWFGTDAYQFIRSTDITIEDNLFHDMHLWLVWDPSTPIPHGDLFQVQTVADDPTAVYGPYRYNRNRYYRGTDYTTVGGARTAAPFAAQGCFISSEIVCAARPDCEIMDNIHVGTQTNSYSIVRAINPKIVNNVVYAWIGERSEINWGDLTNATITGNAAEAWQSLGGGSTYAANAGPTNGGNTWNSATYHITPIVGVPTAIPGWY